jgi:hypothetical protein
MAIKKTSTYIDKIFEAVLLIIHQIFRSFFLKTPNIGRIAKSVFFDPQITSYLGTIWYAMYSCENKFEGWW